MDAGVLFTLRSVPSTPLRGSHLRNRGNVLLEEVLDHRESPHTRRMLAAVRRSSGRFRSVVLDRAQPHGYQAKRLSSKTKTPPFPVAFKLI